MNYPMLNLSKIRKIPELKEYCQGYYISQNIFFYWYIHIYLLKGKGYLAIFFNTLVNISSDVEAQS